MLETFPEKEFKQPQCYMKLLNNKRVYLFKNIQIYEKY